MAVCKDRVSEQGYVTKYHKFTEVSVKNNILNCLLSFYVSKEYRDLNKPAFHRPYSFLITIEEEESMGVRQLAYKKLKELPEWADAEDC